MSVTREQIGRRVEQSDWMDHAVRVGLISYGVVHLLIGWIALQLALGDHEGSANTTGAMRQLAQQPLGEFLIWMVAIGMFLLVLWRLLELVKGHRDKDGGDLWKARAGDVLKAVLYGAVGFSAVSVATHSSGGSGPSFPEKVSQELMKLPAGPFLVGAVGLAVIAYGGNLVWKGFSDKHAKHLATEGKSGEAGKAYLMFGKVGYISKGIAIGLIGVLFVYAAVTHDAAKSGGLDAALSKLLQQPFGPIMLGAIALGIICYGLFCFARARHLSRS
ncbi:DUF1206 domain-containing protein [Nocardioides taihuensis]|uniref:DUF1206 domain-containing protein n=1 Tax=Nocardioides taihuensis TaxID=1835606 RepID=A0ABW0BQH3_9ACTN